MSIKIKKKTIKIIISIILIIAIIAVGIVIAKTIMVNNQIKEAERKLGQIDSQELEDKIIEELENTSLNINLESDDLLVATMFNEGVTFEGYTCVSMLCFKGGIAENNIVGAVEIPCFKITSDSDGKFQNIEYTTDAMINTGSIIHEAIEDVFKDEYDIDLTVVGNSKYNKKFNEFAKDGEYTNKGDVYIDDENFFLGILGQISGRDFEYGMNVDDNMKEYKTVTFGLEF